MNGLKSVPRARRKRGRIHIAVERPNSLTPEPPVCVIPTKLLLSGLSGRLEPTTLQCRMAKPGDG